MMILGDAGEHGCSSDNQLLNTGVCLSLHCEEHLVSLSVGGQGTAGLREGQHCAGISVGDQGRASL